MLTCGDRDFLRSTAAAVGTGGSTESDGKILFFCGDESRTQAERQPADAVESHPEVVAAYTVAGEASAVLVVRASDTGHLERLLERIREHRGVLRTQTQIVLSTLFERPLRLDG